MNRSTGALSQQALFENDSNPSWLALNPSRTHLYSGNETDTYKGASSGSVSAYSIDRSNGRLTLLNTVASGGAGPAYISVHPTGKYVFSANYAGGTVAVLPIRANGEVGDATDVKHDHGPVGPAHAASAPPGSFAISGHDKPHAHTIESDPSGRFVISTDLGMDRILIWKFDSERGKLTPNDPAFVSVPPGDGPRHIVFHPNKRWFYSLQEEGSTIIAFDYDNTAGKLTAKQTVSSLAKRIYGYKLYVGSENFFRWQGSSTQATACTTPSLFSQSARTASSRLSEKSGRAATIRAASRSTLPAIFFIPATSEAMPSPRSASIGKQAG